MFPHPSPVRRLRPWRTGVALAVAGCLIAAPGAAIAAPVPTALQPLGVLSDASAPSCTNAIAPHEASDIDVTRPSNPYGVSSPLDFGGPLPKAQAALLPQLAADALTVELLSSATICSPTFKGLPEAFGGTVASAPGLSRVGRGWRELGGTLLRPAPLTPGDTLIVPTVDDAATLRLSLAGAADRPAASVTLTDLAPGPSTVSIGRDTRGLVASIVRADGTTAETAVPVPAATTRMRISMGGTAKRWQVRSSHRPGTLVYTEVAGVRARRSSDLRRAAAGRTTARFSLRRKPRRYSATTVVVIGVNREAQTLDAQGCWAYLDRRGRPQVAECRAISIDELGQGDLDLAGLLYGLAGRSSTSASRLQVATAARIKALVAAADRPQATYAHRQPIRGRSAAQAVAPLAARPVPIAKHASGAVFTNLRPLAADVNGDGGVDFWTDTLGGEPGSWTPRSGSTAGFVLASGPSGLQPHRLDIPFLDRSIADSEISAIADITGDGLGELVVDIDDRHALIPGSRSWTDTSFPIVTPDPAELGPQDAVLVPPVSSPGTPYATVDDASGDGLPDLASTDDRGAWFGFASSAIIRGGLTRLPTVARVVPTPELVTQTARFDRLAPRVDPRARVIAGQVIGLHWTTVGTISEPAGAVEISVRNGRGERVRALTPVATPGNAVLLDYDRPTGDVLLLSVAPNCLGHGVRFRDCSESLLRVRADGSIRQSIESDPYQSVLAVASARFIADGPDADTEPDVVAAVGNQAVAAVSSTLAGALTEKALPVAKIDNESSPYYEELRLFPVVGRDGARKVMAALRPKMPKSIRDGRFPFDADGSLPVEIAWK